MLSAVPAGPAPPGLIALLLHRDAKHASSHSTEVPPRHQLQPDQARPQDYAGGQGPVPAASYYGLAGLHRGLSAGPLEELLTFVTPATNSQPCLTAQEYNDALLVAYLSSITKGANMCGEVVEKFSVAYGDSAQRGRGATPMMGMGGMF